MSSPTDVSLALIEATDAPRAMLALSLLLTTSAGAWIAGKALTATMACGEATSDWCPRE